ncbi:MAG: hypothetical protein ACLUNW_09645, partial [Prevotella sp.]
MRRILITPEIKRLALQYAKEMEDNDRFRKGKSPQERLRKLANDLRLSSTTIKVKASKGCSGEYGENGAFPPTRNGCIHSL